MSRIVMGYWDCEYCGTHKIKGTLHDCPNCGRQRGKEVRFYMDTDNKEYLPKTKVEGPDWYCDYCGALNKASLNECENCGSPRKESDKDYFSFNKDRKNKEMSDIEASNKTRPTNENYISSKEESNQNYSSFKEYREYREKQEMVDVDTSNETQHTYIEKTEEFNTTSEPIENIKNTFNLVCEWLHQHIAQLGIVSGILLFTLLLFFIFKPRTSVMQVTDVKWTNTIEIEELRTFFESDWYLPPNGRLKYTQPEIRSYKSVLDHYDTVTKSRTVQFGGHYEHSYSDNGNGTFTEHSHYVPEYKTEYYTEQEPVYRQEPVYDIKYYYEIDRWVHERNVITSGNDKEPYWGEVTLKDKEREGTHNTKYTIHGTVKKRNKDKEVSYNVDEATWKELKQPVTIEITTVAGALKEWKYVDNF